MIGDVINDGPRAFTLYIYFSKKNLETLSQVLLCLHHENQIFSKASENTEKIEHSSLCIRVACMKYIINERAKQIHHTIY